MNSSAQIPPGGNQSRPESLDGKQPGSRIGIGVGALLKISDAPATISTRGKICSSFLMFWMRNFRNGIVASLEKPEAMPSKQFL